MKNLLWSCLMFALFQSNAIWWALALLFVAVVLAMAFGGFLFVMLCAVLYREQIRAANASSRPPEEARPSWLPAVEPLPETAPEPVAEVVGRNGKLYEH